MIVRHAALQRETYRSDAFRMERVRAGRGITDDRDLGLGPFGALHHRSLKPGVRRRQGQREL